MKKLVSEGGFEGCQDEDRNLQFGMSSLQKCLPKSLAWMMDSQIVMLGCEICIDAKGSNDGESKAILEG